MSTNEKGTPQSRTYTVNDIAAILGIGRASAYKLANSGLFKTIRIGNMIRISRKSFEDWLKAEGLDDETKEEYWTAAGCSPAVVQLFNQEKNTTEYGLSPLLIICYASNAFLTA